MCLSGIVALIRRELAKTGNTDGCNGILKARFGLLTRRRSEYPVHIEVDSCISGRKAVVVDTFERRKHQEMP